MQQVKDKCQKINDKTVNVKTRFQNECQNCVYLQSKLHQTTIEHQHQIQKVNRERKNKETAFEHEILRLKNKIKDLETAIKK